MQDIAVIYHSPCTDGWCAAYIAANRLGRDKVTLIPCSYGNEVPDINGAKTLYILDFSFPMPVMNLLADQVQDEVIVLDHHKTAQENFAGLDHPKISAVFDMSRSGAAMAWDHFHEARNGIRPDYVNYVQDRDLWTWEKQDSREVNAYLSSLPQSFDSWDEMVDTKHEEHVRDGKAILRYQHQQVENILANKRKVKLDGYEVWSVNTPILQSEVAGELAKQGPFGISWYEDAKGVNTFSLRSTKESGIDVGEIAAKHGGGGHKNASGFQFTGNK